MTFSPLPARGRGYLLPHGDVCKLDIRQRWSSPPRFDLCRSVPTALTSDTSSRDHRPAVLPRGYSGRGPARARQGRFCRPRHDLGAASDVAGADPAGRRHYPAAAHHPGRHFGLDVSARLERLEPEGSHTRLDHRHGRRHAVCELCLERGDRSGRRHDRALVRHVSLAGAVAVAASRAAPPKSRSSLTRSPACSGARSRASCRSWSMSARHPTRSTSCRSASTS